VPLLTHVKEGEELQTEDLDEMILDQNVDKVINHIIQEVLHEDDTFEKYSIHKDDTFEEYSIHKDDMFDEYPIGMPNEAQRVVEDSVVWLCDAPIPVTIMTIPRTIDFESPSKSLTKGQCLTNTMVDFYLKYQE